MLGPMASLQHRLDRLLIRLIARRRGGAQAIRDVAYVREILKFSAVFSLFVLLPMLILAALALRGISADEVAMEVGLRQRAEALHAQVQDEVAGVFRTFEESFRQEVSAGDAAVERLVRDTPGLRASFRFDPNGIIGFPFEPLAPGEVWEAPPAAWVDDMRRATAARGALDRAAEREACRAALSASAQGGHRGVARHCLARRALSDPAATAGELRAVIDDLTLLAAEEPVARDEHGFRVADVAVLLRAEAHLRRGEALAAIELLRRFVEATLAEAWPVGQPGDGFAAQRALKMLEGKVDARWWGRASEELTRRLDTMFWVDWVRDELPLVAGRAAREDAFSYQSEPNALWATLQVQGTVWVFSFDPDTLADHLERSVLTTARRVDPDLSSVLLPSDEGRVGAILRAPLGPYLPDLALVVEPRDPEVLAAQQRARRFQRRLVILLSVLASALGIGAAVQMINRELDAARVKADFAANVSHELRSPIAQIRLKAEALQLDLCYDEDDRRAHYDAIVSEAERLSRLVDNVLDFASIERGAKRYMLRAGDIGDVLRKATEAFKLVAQGAQIEIDARVPDDLPVAWFDRDAMGQVITNLLSNAMKYGSEGRWVGLVAGADDAEVWFTVSDHGIGIAADDVARIFEDYFRVESAEVRARRGTGIGLTIVRYIVEAHHGTISVESELGRGTTFRVALPLSPPPAAVTGG
jgi:signal transduction histidine kinase